MGRLKMGMLDGKTALIAGGTGGVGEGIVRAFLSEGATVIVPSRSSDRLQQLTDQLEDSFQSWAICQTSNPQNNFDNRFSIK